MNPKNSFLRFVFRRTKNGNYNTNYRDEKNDPKRYVGQQDVFVFTLDTSTFVCGAFGYQYTINSNNVIPNNTIIVIACRFFVFCSYHLIYGRRVSTPWFSYSFVYRDASSALRHPITLSATEASMNETTMYVCVWSHIWKEYGSTRSRCQSCSWSAEQGKRFFPVHVRA